MPVIRQYLIFMFGNWEVLESEQLFTNIKDVLESFIIDKEISFVTGNNMLVGCLRSHSSFEEVKGILDEFLAPEVSAYFLMPKPRKLSYRLNPYLEEHLFSKPGKIQPPKPPINQGLKEEGSRLGKEFQDMMVRSVRESVGRFMEEKNREFEENFKKNLTIDKILDKIKDKGFNSLNRLELEFLDNQSKK